MLEAFLDTATQLIVFAAIPFLWWAATTKGSIPFMSWIGLKGISHEKRKTVLVYIIGFIVIAGGVEYVAVPWIMEETKSAMSVFSGKGASALVQILFFAIIKTSLAEEIFFRGFLGKRLSARFGFAVGNTVQALCFGLIHGIALFMAIGVLRAGTFTLITALIAWMEGYINEKKAGGSIYPSWFCHALFNVVSSLSEAF